MIGEEDLRHVREDIIPAIEKDHGVKIIFLCESGSRMWRFASADSDLDCRGIFVPRTENMLRTHRPPDVINYTNEKDGRTYVDLSIWSIQKFGKHFQMSNPSIYEWMQSPIVYYEVGAEMEFAARGIESFSRSVLRKHYVSMAKGNFLRKCKGDDTTVSAKKYLYVLRAVACVMCLDCDELPPVRYEGVIGFLPIFLQIKMRHFIDVKMTTEDMRVPLDPQMTEFMTEFIAANHGRPENAPILKEEVEQWVVVTQKTMGQI